MKVTLPVIKPIYYHEVLCGETFTEKHCPGVIFIKSDHQGASGIAAINLNNGARHSYKDEDLVTRVDAEVVVHG